MLSKSLYAITVRRSAYGEDYVFFSMLPTPYYKNNLPLAWLHSTLYPIISAMNVGGTRVLSLFNFCVEHQEPLLLPSI